MFRKGRIIQSYIDNYKFFYEELAKKKIPIIVIITGCEDNDPMECWFEENKQYFDNSGLKFDATVSTCFAEGGRLESIYGPLREESKCKVWDAIKLHIMNEPIILIDKNEIKENFCALLEACIPIMMRNNINIIFTLCVVE